MILPANYMLHGVIGGTLDYSVTITKDGAPMDLTPYVGTLIVGTATFTLTLGSDGTFTIALSPTDTATLPVGASHYVVKLAKSGDVIFPLSGDLIMVKP